MAEISNVLGSGGYSGGFLGNLTSGLEALQRTDIASKLEAIRQQKAWDRDDKMRNEAFALEMALPKIIEDRRIGLAQETAQKADLFTKKLTDVTRKAQAEGRGLSLAEKIALKTERGVLLNESERAKAFIDALEEGQKFHLQTLQKLDPTQKDEYMNNWSTLYSKMKDPSASKTLSASDVMTALQPPEPTSSMVFAQTTKDLIPFVDSAIKAEGGGRTSVDFDKLKKVIASNVDQNSYLYQKGIQEGRWKNVDEMYNQMAERIAPSIKTDVVGWKPNEPTEKEKFGGIIGTATAANVSGSTPNYTTENAYITTNWGKPIPITTKEGIGQFTPKQSFPNGMVQGTVKVSRENIGKERDYTDVENDQLNQPGSRIEITQSDEKGNPTKARLITKSVIERTEEIPWSKHSEVLGKLDPNMKSYFESQGIGSRQEQKQGKIPMERTSNTVTLKVNGKTYNIPEDKVAKFKETYPNAK